MFGKTKIYGKAQLLGTTGDNIFSVILLIFTFVLCLALPLGAYILLEMYGNISPKYIENIIVGLVFFITFSFLFLPTVFGFCNRLFTGARDNDFSKNAWLVWYRPALALKSFAYYLLIFVLKFLWFIALNVPAVAVASSTVYTIIKYGLSEKIFLVLMVLSIALLVVGSFFAFVISQRYFMTPYIIMADNSITITEAVRKSTYLMNNICFKTAMFKLSFTGWFLSCIILAPVFYVLPYYKISCINFAKECTQVS